LTTTKCHSYFNCDGVTRQFPFSFDYLNPRFIKATIGDQQIVYGTDFTIDKGILSFQTAPTAGKLCIYRQTPTDRLVKWEDGSVLKAVDMSTTEIQQLHIAEENVDFLILNGMVCDAADNCWSGLERRIKDVNPPINNKDVVTKEYMESVQDGFVHRNTVIESNVSDMEKVTLDAKNTAVTSYQESLSSANVSTTKAKEATEQATNAKASENAAKVSESNASLSAQAAALSEQHAAASATEAKLSETNTATMKQDVSGMKDTVLAAKDKVAADLAASQVIQQDLATKDLSKYALQSDVDAKIEAINLSPYANVADSVLKFPNGGRIWVG